MRFSTSGESGRIEPTSVVRLNELSDDWLLTAQTFESYVDNVVCFEMCIASSRSWRQDKVGLSMGWVDPRQWVGLGWICMSVGWVGSWVVKMDPWTTLGQGAVITFTFTLNAAAARRRRELRQNLRRLSFIYLSMSSRLQHSLKLSTARPCHAVQSRAVTCQSPPVPGAHRE